VPGQLVAPDTLHGAALAETGRWRPAMLALVRRRRAGL